MRPDKPEDLEAWDKADGRAQLAILSAIDSSQLNFVSTCNTAAHMWSNLKAIYEQADEASKLEANRAYHSYVYNNESMAIHIATVENLAEKCKLCGDPKSEMDIITKLLDRIPREYSTAHVAMSLTGTDKQNVDTVKRLLLSEELRINQTSKDNEEALHVKKDRKDKYAGNSKPGNNSQYKFKKAKQCYTCGEKGHFKRECPKYKDYKSDKSKNKYKNNKTDNVANHACFNCVTEAMNGNKDDRILADNGASCHIMSIIKFGSLNLRKEEKL